jgi:hypothetical protein
MEKKFGPLVNITFFSRIKMGYIFSTISVSKSLKSPVFQCTHKGKVEQYIVSKFGLFPALSGKIHPKVGRGFVWPPLFYSAPFDLCGRTFGSWQH